MAVAPVVVGLIVGAVGIAGYSIYRSNTPVDMLSAFDFFSSCWSCNLFGGIISGLSDIISATYSSLADIIFLSIVLITAIWIAWGILSHYLAKFSVPDSPWTLAGQYGTHFIRATFVIALLYIPLPRIITGTFIEPIFSIGLSYGRIMDRQFSPSEHANAFETCLITTAANDPSPNAKTESFSPSLRHNLVCQIAMFHRLTGTGMTVGWTLLNSAFNSTHMYQIMGVPVFPNIGFFLIGLLIVLLYVFATFPVPLYFLKIIVELAMDFLLLPLLLLGWLFQKNPVFPVKESDIQTIIDKLIKNTAGIAVVGIFTTFSLFFLNALFSPNNPRANIIATAFQNNDPEIFMNGVALENNSIMMMIFIGIFLTMFMTSIPTLVNELFKTVGIPKEYYEKAKQNMKTANDNIKNMIKLYRKKPQDKKE